MKQWLAIDTNLLLLLLVGRVRQGLVEKRIRLRQAYSIPDFSRLSELVALWAGLVVAPQRMIADVNEVWVPGGPVAQGGDMAALGMMDAILLWLVQYPPEGRLLCVLTADRVLANRAYSLGHPVLHYDDV